MNEEIHNKRLNIIEEGLEKRLEHLRKWRQYHLTLEATERDYAFFKSENSGLQTTIIKLSDMANSGNFITEIKNIFRQTNEWYFGAYSPDENKLIHPVLLYDRKNLDYANDLRTPFLMPLIHQLKDAYLESQKLYSSDFRGS